MSIIDRPTQTVKADHTAGWPEWTNQSAWGLGPVPSLYEAAVTVRDHYRRLADAPGSELDRDGALTLIADTLADLANELRVLGYPASIEQYADRRQAMDAGR